MTTQTSPMELLTGSKFQSATNLLLESEHLSKEEKYEDSINVAERALVEAIEIAKDDMSEDIVPYYINYAERLLINLTASNQLFGEDAEKQLSNLAGELHKTIQEAADLAKAEEQKAANKKNKMPLNKDDSSSSNEDDQSNEDNSDEDKDNKENVNDEGNENDGSNDNENDDANDDDNDNDNDNDNDDDNENENENENNEDNDDSDDDDDNQTGNLDKEEIKNREEQLKKSHPADEQIIWENLEAARIIVEKTISKYEKDATKRKQFNLLLSDIYHKLGELNNILGRIFEAKEEVRKSLGIRLAENDSRKVCEAYYTFGCICLTEIGNESEAIDSLKLCKNLLSKVLNNKSNAEKGKLNNKEGDIMLVEVEAKLQEAEEQLQSKTEILNELKSITTNEKINDEVQETGKEMKEKGAKKNKRKRNM